MERLTHRESVPKPKSRRRRGDTGQAAFARAAYKIMRRAVRLPARAYARAPFLFDTLDWLNPWHHETHNTSALDADLHRADANHLSHHP